MNLSSLTPYERGWNDWLDSKGQDDNPWTECSNSGYQWMQGRDDAERTAEQIGLSNMERKNELK